MREYISILSIMGSLLAGLGCTPTLTVHPPADDIRNQQTQQWLKIIEEKAAPGDWLIIRGYTDSDHLVAAATNIPISHAAVLDKKQAVVIEAVGSGVRIASLQSFVHNSHRILLMRPKWWTPERGVEAVRRAHSTVGKKYDFLGAIGGDDPDRFYCTELAVWTYQPHHSDNEQFPYVLEPGQMYLWADILFDSRPRN